MLRWKRCSKQESQPQTKNIIFFKKNEKSKTKKTCDPSGSGI